MRLIWMTEHGAACAHFQALLEMKGIETVKEESVDQNWGSDHYGIPLFRLWIIDEDRLEEAKAALAQFLHEPLVPKVVHVAPKPENPKSTMTLSSSKASRLSVSNLIILICSMLLLFAMGTEKPASSIPPSFRDKILTTSPIEKALLYDYPESYVLLDKLSSLYGYDTLLTPTKLPPAGQFLYTTYLHTQSWNGLYPYLIQRSLPEEMPPLFEKIREGEVYRLVTPIFLHGDFLHLFFNMVWLLLIGNEMEKHLSPLRFLFFILVVAIASNTAQYLISGPAFIGFSGVICAIAFFIHARQKTAPWEGYQLSKPTFQFILFFIGALLFLSLLAFLLEFFGKGTFPIQIANTAHLVGALSGHFLGRLKLFNN